MRWSYGTAFIVDEAHMVFTGFNALLKIVEEPPEHLIFISRHHRTGEGTADDSSLRTHHHPFRLPPPRTMGVAARICEQ